MGWLRRICRSRHHPAAFVKMPRSLCPSGLGEGIIFQFRLQILCSFVISSPFFCTLTVSFHVSGVRAGIEPATIDLLLYRPHPWSAWFLCSTMAELPHSYFSFNFCIPYVIPLRQEPACSAGSSAISLQPAFNRNSSVTSASWIAKSSFNVISSCSSWSVRYSDASAGVLMYSYYSTSLRRLHWTCGLLSGYALSYHGTVPACGHSFGHFSVSQDFTFTVPESSDTALPCS